MPGYLLHVGATVLCAHGGQAQPGAPSPRVKVNGAPALTTVAPHTVAGCPMVTGGSPTPCATAQWTTGATRVTSEQQPLLLLDSQASCVPNGTPVTVVATQTRVTAQ
ncbi:hypothetical protein GCM10009555_058340 [Acrocarpospora macrocephala]|uniref:DUF4280 domain-containing protein n=1 Tax=Acrocarpospora macrocephala TaxID=150177 RepID=A0A5M3WX99_9ACTN|nr:hypothetical protein [Acrocarpospora macrocephala]GES11941.1 hypothetical protein Amac_055380 [Acrocarpospora macrocephala]